MESCCRSEHLISYCDCINDFEKCSCYEKGTNNKVCIHLRFDEYCTSLNAQIKLGD